MKLTQQLIDDALAGKWRSKAACRDVPVSEAEWFPGIHQAPNARVQRAKQVCATCPVRDECLVWGLYRVTAREGGIYGGLTARGRKAKRAELEAEGYVIALRECARCNQRFSAKVRSQRSNVLCPTCREQYNREWDRAHGRSGTVSRAKARLRRGEKLTPAEQAVIDAMA